MSKIDGCIFINVFFNPSQKKKKIIGYFINKPFLLLVRFTMNPGGSASLQYCRTEKKNLPRLQIL